jgi:hypothetical protein
MAHYIEQLEQGNIVLQQKLTEAEFLLSQKKVDE